MKNTWCLKILRGYFHLAILILQGRVLQAITPLYRKNTLLLDLQVSSNIFCLQALQFLFFYKFSQPLFARKYSVTSMAKNGWLQRKQQKESSANFQPDFTIASFFPLRDSCA